MNKPTFAFLANFTPPVVGIITVYLVKGEISYSYDNVLSYLLILSILAFVLSSTVFTMIEIGVSSCRHDRQNILSWYLPLLRFSQFATVVIVFCHGYIITVSVFFLEAYYLGRVHFILIGLVGIMSAWTALRVLWISLNQFKEAEIDVSGRVVTKYQQPQLWSIVEEVSILTSSPMVDNIIIGFLPSFFVTEAKIKFYNSEIRGKTLYLSLPFIHLLSISELQAIIAHEMGHYIGNDTEFSRKFYPIYSGINHTMKALITSNNKSNPDVSIIATLPAFSLILLFFERFTSLEREISRQRELQADSLAANTYGAEALATALIKVHIYSSLWPIIQSEMVKNLIDGKVVSNIPIYIKLGAKCIVMDEAIKKIDSYHIEHPINTHPSLKTRLILLKYDIDAALLNDLQNDDEDSSHIIKNLNQIEEDLTNEENERLINFIRELSKIKTDGT